MYQKKERKNFCKKPSPHLSQLNVAMAHKNYFRQNNLQILKLATYIQRLKITILGANWQLFRLERISKCSYFILSTQNIKFYWFVMKIKKFLLPIWWYNRGSFPLGNKYFGVFVLNGLMDQHIRVKLKRLSSNRITLLQAIFKVFFYKTSEIIQTEKRKFEWNQIKDKGVI